MAYLVGKLYRETKKERTDTLIQNAPIANCLPTGSTADRIAEQFNVSGRAEARLHIVCLPADPARDHVLIPRENAGRRIDDMKACRRGYSTLSTTTRFWSSSILILTFS